MTMVYNNFIDDSILDYVWETKIPFRIVVQKEDLSSSYVPINLYYSLPRVGYLSNIFRDIMKNIGNVFNTQLSDMWLEYNKIPLKWQIPIGVLVDSLQMDYKKGPITIKIRLKQIHINEVLKFDNLDKLKTFIFNSLKESDFIKYYHSIEKPWVNATIDEMEKMEQIINENNSKNVTEWKKIMDKKLCRGQKKIEKFPTKVVFCSNDIILCKPAKINEGSENDYTMYNYFIDTFTEIGYNKIKENCKILIHGLEVEEEMQFLFYYFNFCYIDTFLYISFVEKELKKSNNDVKE